MKKLMRIVEEMSPAEKQAKNSDIALQQEKIKDATERIRTAKSPLEKEAAQDALAVAKEDLAQAKAVQENISEETRKYTTQESAAVGKEVLKSLVKVLVELGHEMKGKETAKIYSGVNKFSIEVKYGHDGGDQRFDFKIDPQDANNKVSIKTPEGSYDTLVDDVKVLTGGKGNAELNTPTLEDNLRKSTALQKYISGPSDEEYDDMAAMQAPTDPSQLNKNIAEDLDVGHQDNEPAMLKRDVYRIAKMASMLYKQLDKYDNGQEVDFPHWWQAKIIKAYDYLQAAYGYLDGEEKVQQIDNTVVATMALNEKKATYCGRCGYTHVEGTPCPRPFKEGAVKEAAKPDYLDLDKDGNKKESMKKAAQDKKITKKELEEVILEAYIEVLREVDKPALRTSTQEILGKFPTVKKTLVSLFTHEYDEFIEDVKWTVPKPSTFKVVLKNGQPFDLKWTGKGFEATIEGKGYLLNNVTQYQQALDAVGRILRDGPISQGEEPGGEEFGGAPAEPAAGGGGGGDFPGGEAGGAEEAPAEPGAEAGGAEDETPTSL